jgi:hypothetical protein
MMMNLRPRVMDPRRRDEISEALQVAVGQTLDASVPLVYLSNWYPPGLRECTLGAHSKGLVGMTRYYPTLEPKVVVDFEPAPPDRWWHDEKAQFCQEHGIVYFAIGLHDRLTVEQFVDRYKDARMRLDRAHVETLEDKALADVSFVETALMREDIATALNAKALALATEMRDPNGRVYGGAIKLRNIRVQKQQLVDYYRKKLRHGMDPDECYRELTDTAERRSDGQVPASAAG